MFFIVRICRIKQQLKQFDSGNFTLILVVNSIVWLLSGFGLIDVLCRILSFRHGHMNGMKSGLNKLLIENSAPFATNKISFGKKEERVKEKSALSV